MHLLRIVPVLAAVLAAGAVRADGAWSVQLKGCVKNAEGAPVPGAVLQIVRSGFRPVTADARGCYQIADVPLGIHTVSVSVQGAVRLTTKVEVNTDKPFVVMDFRLHPAAPAQSAGPVMLDLQALSRAELRPDDPAPARRADVPPRTGIAAVRFVPERVPGGQAARGVIELAKPAPASGLSIKIGSSISPAFAADVVVHVPEGSTTAGFEIPTKKVDGASDVVVKLRFADGDARHETELVVESGTRLIVRKEGTGSGAVVSEPAGIDCGARCSAPFAEGLTVKLAAAPGAGSVFAGWSSGCANGAVQITGIMNCIATFNLP